MKEFLHINDFRASIFMPQIPYNNKTLQELLPLFEGYVPSMMQPTLEFTNNQPRIINTPNSQWALIANNRNTEIVFNENKVDVLIHSKQAYSVDVLKMLANKATKILTALIEKYGNSSSRLAIAPILSIEGILEEKMTEFVCSKFANQKFKSSNMSNASFTNVYRVVEKINGEDFLNNYNIKVKTLNSLNIENNNIRIFNSLICELDINTFPDPQYRFDIDKIKDFYTHSPEWTDDFVDFYFA